MKNAIQGLLVLAFMTTALQAEAKTRRQSTSGGSYAGRSCYYPKDDMTCRLCAAVFEGGSQGLNGMTQVLKTVETRMASGGDYPKTACGVIYERGQFTYNKRSRLPNNETLRLAVQAVAKAKASGPNGATHYLNPYATRKMNHGKLPRWAYTCPKVNVVGSGKNQHIFYRCPGIITNGEIAAAQNKARRQSVSAADVIKSKDLVAQNVPRPTARPEEMRQVEEAKLYPEDMLFGSDAGR